jgi:hypothetical protein
VTTPNDQSLKIQATPDKDLARLQARALELYPKVPDAYRDFRTSAIDLGKALVAVRNKMKKLGHGKFADWYREHSLDQNRVMYCIRLAEGKIAMQVGRKKLKTKEDREREAARQQDSERRRQEAYNRIVSAEKEGRPVSRDDMAAISSEDGLPDPKPPTPAEVAAKSVLRSLSRGFFPSCEMYASKPTESNLRDIRTRLLNAIGDLLLRAIMFLGFEIVREDERVKEKIRAVKAAASELFDVLLQAAQEKKVQQERVEEVV